VACLLLGLIMCVVLARPNAYWAEGRPDDRGRPYPGAVIGMACCAFSRVDPRGEHRANSGFDRRIGGGGRDLHDSRVLPGEGVAGVRRAGVYWKSTALMLVGPVLECCLSR
jgi:hypothetical protein